VEKKPEKFRQLIGQEGGGGGTYCREKSNNKEGRIGERDKKKREKNMVEIAESQMDHKL